MKLTPEEVEALSKLRKMLSSLSREELRVFEYLWDNISVGEILFIRDLESIYHIKRPDRIARRLREKGLIARGEGCYNLPPWLRVLRKKITSFEDLVRVLEKIV